MLECYFRKSININYYNNIRAPVNSFVWWQVISKNRYVSVDVNEIYLIITKIASKFKELNRLNSNSCWNLSLFVTKY